jgi:hypothetical protein
LRLLLLGALALFALHSLSYWRMMVDDAFITYRYAENLGLGFGPVWNRGERGVEGYSNLSLVLLLAPFARAGMNLFVVSKVIGFLSGLGTMLLLAALARFYVPEGSRFAILPAYFLAGSASFALWSMAGIETTLFAMLLLSALYFYVKWVEHAGGRTAAVLSGLAIAGAALTRPEGVLFGAALGVDLLLRVLAARRLEPLQILWGLCFTIPFLALTAWRYSYYGALAPNTYYAKAWGGLALRLKSVRYGYEFVMVNGGGLLIALLALAIILHGARRYRPLLFFVGANVLFVINSGDDWMPMHRFFVPSLAVLFLLVSEGIRGVWERMGAARTAVTALLVVAFAGFAYAEERYTTGDTRAHFRHEGEFAVAAWLNEHARPDARIAVDSAGIIPYYSKLWTLDYLGLSDGHIARLPGFLHDKSDPDYVLSHDLDYVIMCGTDFDPKPEEIAAYDVPGFRGPEDDIMRHPKFRERYEFAALFPMGNGSGIVWKRRESPPG